MRETITFGISAWTENDFNHPLCPVNNLCNNILITRQRSKSTVSSWHDFLQFCLISNIFSIVNKSKRLLTRGRVIGLTTLANSWLPWPPSGYIHLTQSVKWGSGCQHKHFTNAISHIKWMKIYALWWACHPLVYLAELQKEVTQLPNNEQYQSS